MVDLSYVSYQNVTVGLRCICVMCWLGMDFKNNETLVKENINLARERTTAFNQIAYISNVVLPV